MEEFKCYDVVLTITQGAIRWLMKVIQGFGEFSGQKINVQKPKIITRYLMEEDEGFLHKESSCHVIESVKYLGLSLTGKNQEICYDHIIDSWKGRAQL